MSGTKRANERCPLQAECERKCQHDGHELDCDYYEANAREGYTIEDQEQEREKRWRENEEKMFDAEISADPIPGVGQLVYLPIDQLHPHPNNPRKDLGDLTELADSIKAKGILQNLTVIPMELVDPDATVTLEGSQYTILIGHRRHAAAKLAGLQELPCIITSMDEKEQLQTMLLENIQRSDLTIYEQANGFQMMIDLGSTVKEISEKSGFSKSAIRSRLKIMELNQETLKEVSSRQIALADFDRLAQIKSIEKRNKALTEIGTHNFDRMVVSAIHEEHREKVTPEAKKQIKELGLKELPEKDRYSSKYDQISQINLDVWEPKNGLGLKSSDGVLYLLDRWGTIYFYRRRQKASPVKKSKEQIAREKAIENARAMLKEERAIAYELRKKFVEGIPVSQKTVPLLLRGAAIAIARQAVLYKPGDRDALVKLLGVDPKSNFAEIRKEAMKSVGAQEDNKLAPAIIYTAFEDGKNNGYFTDYKGVRPSHDGNLSLDALYGWLKLMGYEMSDAEKAMQDGTHSLFREDGAKDGNEESGGEA